MEMKISQMKKHVQRYKDSVAESLYCIFYLYCPSKKKKKETKKQTNYKP